LSRPLREHQAKNDERFHDKHEMALFWEMGVGKTTSAIVWARRHYQRNGRVLRTLVVSPVATLYNWLEEFKINAPEKVWSKVQVPYMRTKTQKHTNAERSEIINLMGEGILVLNPECFDSDGVVGAILKFSPELVIIDEAHRFKSHVSKRLKKLLSVTDRAGFRAILTGTPILNSYLDLWAPFRILDKGQTFGTNPFVFREQYFQDKNLAWKGKPKYFPLWVPKPGIEAHISKLIETKSSRITKEECLDLPPLIFEKRYVQMSAEQLRTYKQMEEQLVAEVREGLCAATNALAKVMRLLQILSGHLPVLNEEQSDAIVKSFKENPRLDSLKDILIDVVEEQKAIIWCTFTENYKQVRELLDSLKVPFAELTSATKNRQEEIDRFQTDETCRVMLSNPQAGGVGVNLTAASIAIYYSRSYSLGDRLQSEARCHRGGSEKYSKITIIDLVCKDTLDEDVLSALLRKENFSDNVLDRLKSK
jgi:SNF2 family DNA or RNA helicase